MALILQKLVLPMMPSMHAGHGLMKDDAIYFHGVAEAVAAKIRMNGWSEWKLIISDAATGNVGILAAVYAIFGPEPAWFLPINAGMHAVGSLLIVLIALQIIPTRTGLRAGLIAGLIFLVLPSALIWYGQNHKDAFVIAGFLLCLYAFIAALQRSGWSALASNALFFGCGIALIAVMRAHLVLIYVAAFACAWGIICVMWVFEAGKKKRIPSIFNLTLLLLIGVLALPLLPEKNEFVENGGIFLDEGSAQLAGVSEGAQLSGSSGGSGISEGAAVSKKVTLVKWKWQDSEYLPHKIDGVLKKVSSIRTHFVNYGLLAEAGSIIDASKTPSSAVEMLSYLPRALQIGLFAPFPDFWVQRLSLPRVIGSFETLIFYLFIPGMVYAIFRGFDKSILICVVVAGAVLIVQAYVSPNLGTLHRSRYGQWLVFLMIGACGWMLILERFSKKITKPNHGDAGGGADAAVLPSAGRAASAGVLVMMVSLVGFLGLLVRDLLLIDKVGFGERLDSYYLAMMPPMFFIAILTAPLGDALSTKISQISDKEKIQKILSSISALTLIVFLIISGILWFFEKEVFSAFSKGGQIERAGNLFPFALLLLVFSGLIVAGNSLLNSFGKPVLAASAQLIVPVVVIISILFSGQGDVIMVAMLGMAVGQFANLVLLCILLYRYKFSLRPAALGTLSNEHEMLSNFKWLSLCALLTSISVPINYWFAGNIGSGTVSTWALGSKLVQVSSVLGTALMTAVFVPYMSKIVASGGKKRIREDILISLISGAWGSVVFVAAVYVFAEPVVFAAANGSSGNENVGIRVVEIIKLGALQLPFVLSSILIFKLCAVSSVSLKAVFSALSGLIVNVLLNFILVPKLGVVGLALAATLASLFSALMAIGMTRKESHLSVTDISMIVSVWVILLGLAGAIHFHSLTTALVMIILGAALMVWQLKAFSMKARSGLLA
jgi:O-antigen/teichoic acid export membrane protein